MKKLMFAAAALTAGFAMAGDAITSANVVGFQGADLNAWAARMVGAQFVKVGDDATVRLGDLVPVGDDTADTVEIQILNDDGTSNTALDYLWDGAKWTFAMGGADASAVTFDPGQGMWVYSNSDEPARFQSAGEVGTKLVEFPLNAWAAAGVANPFPVGRSLTQIVPVGDDTADTVEIQILNDDGTSNTALDYLWNGEKWTFAMGGEDASAVVIGAGIGMWVYSNSDEPAVLRITAPEL